MRPWAAGSRGKPTDERAGASWPPCPAPPRRGLRVGTVGRRIGAGGIPAYPSPGQLLHAATNRAHNRASDTFDWGRFGIIAALTGVDALMTDKCAGLNGRDPPFEAHGRLGGEIGSSRQRKRVWPHAGRGSHHKGATCHACAIRPASRRSAVSTYNPALNHAL